ncbi:hypothetical protein F5X99DRAFT_408594 [Biscogniauxia marginata]|nr:hypothetical protein F5X99DRAFT_408594 [Biscogniauxia marginata]
MDKEGHRDSAKQDDAHQDGAHQASDAQQDPDEAMVDVDDEHAPDQVVYEATSYEVDKNNVIRGLHSDKARELRVGPKEIAAVLLSDPEKSVPNQRAAGWQPIVQRTQREIAIGIDQFKRPLVLHDLVNEDNVSLMVINDEHAIIQGHHEEVRATIEKVFETQGEKPEDNISVYIRDVYGESAARERLDARRFSLVDMQYRYKLMERKRADRLMAKEWLDPAFDGLVIAELRPADPSPAGALKPGRRLLPIESEEDSTGLRQVQFCRRTKEDTGSVEAQMTSYMEVLANKKCLG